VALSLALVIEELLVLELITSDGGAVVPVVVADVRGRGFLLPTNDYY